MQQSQCPRPLQRANISGELSQMQSERRAREAADALEPRETILVVENEEINRSLMEQILGFAGYRSISASNGLEALGVLDRERVDLVLIDLSMPVLDGYRATEIIRRRPDGADLPIVAVTAHAMSEDRELALAAGCTDYLAKPYRPAELLSLIERLLNADHAEDAE